MTERERLLGLDQPEWMVLELSSKGSNRKCCSFGLALCRELTPYLADPRSLEALAAVGEWIQRGDQSKLAVARQLADRAARAALFQSQHDHSAVGRAKYNASACVVMLTILRFPHPSLIDLVQQAEKVFVEIVESVQFRVKQADLLREIFFDHFVPVSLERRWLTSTVTDLVRSIDEELVFDRMPILGDALLDAGCDSEEIISHCHGNGPHVRGCWVIDLLTSKK